ESLPVIYPFPLHLSTAGHQKPGISPLVKIQRARVVKIQCAPTALHQKIATPRKFASATLSHLFGLPAGGNTVR
ncbi:MAG: hypothetical protein ACLQHK_05760, partial [Gallionellaceae bacterium]